MSVSRPKLVDWFCCEGGAAMGYHQAGFDVIGVDDKPQPRYPFPFIRADCLDEASRLLEWADAVHASPPCQFGSEVTPDWARGAHVNLIPPTRKLLLRSGKPYVIENVRKVAAAHLINPVYLTGTMFDMHVVDSRGRRFDLERTRGFETNWPLLVPWEPGAQHPIANVFGGHFRVRSGEFRTAGGTERTVDLPGENRQALARKLMQMEWATMQGISEAVPPPFTEYIGEKLLAYLEKIR